MIDMYVWVQEEEGEEKTNYKNSITLCGSMSLQVHTVLTACTAPGEVKI